MKFLICCILIVLWCINYRIYYMHVTEHKKNYFVFYIILQTICNALVICLLCPHYYSKHSFWAILDIPLWVFICYAFSIFFSLAFYEIYKLVCHHYARKIKNASHKDTLQFIKDVESADNEISKFFIGPLFYIIMIILTLLIYV